MDGHLLRFSKTVKLCFIDVETFNLCLSMEFNRPWQVGIVNVVGENIVSEHDLYIKWPKVEGLTCSVEAARINHYDESKVNSIGLPPEEAFSIMYKCLSESDYIVGHNVFNFDIYLLKDFYKKMGKDWRFITEKVIDTKALIAGVKQNVIFNPKTDNLTSYQYRVTNTRAKGVKTALATVAKEYDIPFDASKLHDALYDLRVNVAFWNKLKFLIEL